MASYPAADYEANRGIGEFIGRKRFPYGIGNRVVNADDLILAERLLDLRNHIDCSQGKAFLDGEECMDAVSFSIIFTPTVK